MLFLVAALVLSASEDGQITENFTGRVLDGSNDRLARVERLGVSKRSPQAIVVMRGCGPVDAGSTHRFLTWAGAWDDVRACLAVDGRAHVPELRAGFGVVYGKVHEVRDEAVRLLGGVALRAVCGDRVFAGRSDARGRFWTMLPAGHCRIESAASGFRPYDSAIVSVREGAAEVVSVRMRPWGLLDRIGELAGSVQGMFRNN
jgi:hypothetical protein